MTINYFNNCGSALDYSRAMVSLMKKFAEPLFSNSCINNFSYIKFYQNNSVINLTTDTNWIDYRFKENIKYKILFESELNNSTLDKPHMYFWPNETNDKLLCALHHFGITNGCNIYIPSQNHIEVFSFASAIDKTNMHNFYINNFHALTQFILYFKNELSSIIDHESPENKIVIDINFPVMKLQKNTNSLIARKKNLIMGDIKRIQFSDNIYLTYKEAACCYFLNKGYSLKDISNKLSISARTVETHINHVKNKANCYSKSLLLQMLNKKQWILVSIFE